MKKSLLAASALAGISLLFTASFQISSLLADKIVPEKSDVFKPAKLSKQDRIDLAMQQEFELTKDLSLNTVPRERLVQAETYRRTLIEKAAASRTTTAVPGLVWQERGPSNVGGRTRALLFDLNDAANGYKKVWAGSVGGGLWFTNDITVASPVWNRVDDLFENMAITAIVQNPANPQEMYFGTGEGWFNSDAIRGLGIWKSTNGGASWTRLSSTANFSYVNDLLIDNAGNLYAAVRQYYGSDAAGVQKSTNGGTSWTQVLGSPVFGSNNRGADLELAANGDIYATLGTTGSNGGVYQADFAVHGTATGNAGTWTNITPNTTGTIATPASFWHRIELAPAPSNGNIVYALFQGSGSNNCTSIQRYDKATNTWSVKTVPTIIDQGSNSNFSRGQAWYNLTAAVDPANENSFYIGGIDALRSDDGGTSFTQMTTWSLYMATGFNANQNVHADQHAIVFAPGSSARALWGSDGGVHYTANANIAAGSKPTFSSKNTGYNVTQYYACAMSPTLSNVFLAGAQDNGTQKFSSAGINATSQASGGDGGFCHIDQDNNNIQITSYVYNNYYISTNGGASFASRSFGNTGGFINPTDYDNTANILYAGNTAGSYFRWNDPATGGTSTNNVTCAQFSGASVTHVFVSPTVANRVFFGLSNGSVVMVDNAHTGTDVVGVVIRTGSGSVSCIAADAANAAHMLVTYSNYGATSIVETMNADAATPAWTAVEGNLPDMPVRWVMFDPRNADWAIIATETGIWSTADLAGSGTNWQPTNSGMANVRVDMLQYRASDKVIAAATHGRGLFTAQLPAVLPVTLTAFTGQLEKSWASLQWSTSAEQGAKDFVVEKSTDGIAYFIIGTVAARGNSTDPVTYAFRDHFLSPANYYRLRMTDANNSSKLSQVVLIKTADAKQTAWLVNNPFQQHIDLRFASSAKQVRLQLINLSGVVVQETIVSNPAGVYRWDLSQHLARGSYIIRGVADGQVFNLKAVKQ
jgi:hypothetical protein